MDVIDADDVIVVAVDVVIDVENLRYQLNQSYFYFELYVLQEVNQHLMYPIMAILFYSKIIIINKNINYIYY